MKKIAQLLSLLLFFTLFSSVANSSSSISPSPENSHSKSTYQLLLEEYSKINSPTDIKNGLIEEINLKYNRTQAFQTSETSDIDSYISQLNQKYEENQKLERDKERTVGEILTSLYPETNFVTLATSITKEDKITVMKKIIETIDNNKGSSKQVELLQYYVNKFAPYAGEPSLERHISNKQNVITPQAASNSQYDRTVAKQYITNYWNTYNTPKYPNLNNMGGDCANFVSQVLHAGGLAMDTTGGWYINSKQSPPTYPSPSNVTQFNHSWGTADPSPWISAKQFNNRYSGGYSASVDLGFTGQGVIDNIGHFHQKLWTGDVVQLLQKKLWWYEAYHTMVVYTYDSSDVYLAAHSSSTNNTSLKSLAARSTDKKFDFFYIKNGL
ncbi:amidase domain-containing protein [Paenibacillus assamensis]|uniref:amidase domain-containing protein n=1 Tax=Paenibacillus assamensis TaxID=311244 RepID=UPI0004017BFF|nr:amidase domain-containing protein [Paenibacillus assamensis]